MATVIVSPTLLGREHQVVLDHRNIDAEVGQPVVAHVFRAVAVEAVVDERARAALQRLDVQPVDRRLFHPQVAPLKAAAGADAGSKDRRAEQAQRALFFIRSPLSGTGLVLSSAVYHGIRRKNRK